MGFADNFLKGQRAMGDLIDTYNEARQQAEFDKINKAEAPTNLQGFTPEQGQQLESLAGRGYRIEFDPVKNAYVAKNAADTQMIAAQGVTDFMGQRTAGTQDADTARTMAMADVIGQRDPMKAVQLRWGAKNQAFQSTKQDRELKKFADEDAITAIKKRLGEDMQAGLTDADGNTRAAGVDDYLQNTQKLAVELMKGGHTDEAGKAFKDYQAQAFTKLQLQTGERKQAAGQAAAALAAGNAAPIAEMLNKYVPGANFTDVQMGKDGSLTLNAKDVYGNAMPAQTIPSAQALAMLKSFDDPMAVYNLSLSEFQRQLQGNADKRADATLQLARNRDAREGAKASRDAAEHQGKMSVIDALGAERGMSPTQIAAVKAGVLKFPEDKADAYEVQAGDVTSLLGTPAVDKDGNPLADPMTGKQLVNRDPAKEAAFFQWMRQNNITDTNKGLAIYLGQQQNAPQAPASVKGRESSGKVVDLRNVSDADYEATAKKYGISVEEVKRRLGVR